MPLSSTRRRVLQRPSRRLSNWAAGGVAAAVAGSAAALWNRKAAASVEQALPPIGRFLEISGVNLHYLRRDAGAPIVLIHGNQSMLQDWLISGIVDELAATNEVIAFDRPGCGFSSRPRSTIWTPAAQAKLIAEALLALGVRKACIVAHSFGALVAAAMAVNHPGSVKRLVLLSGFYFPSPRIDAVLSGVNAVPLIGDALRYTVVPLYVRAMKHVMYRTMFSPAPVTLRWRRDFPFDLTTRPSQVHATAADAALMLQGAAALVPQLADLHVPVTIVTGDGDKVISPEGQSVRLHREVPHSRLVVVPEAGHMVHHISPKQVLAAIRAEADDARYAS